MQMILEPLKLFDSQVGRTAVSDMVPSGALDKLSHFKW